MPTSPSDSPKPSVRFDNSETKIRNRETCLEQVSSVVYMAAGVDHSTSNNFLFVFAKPCDRLDHFKLYSVFGSGFLIDHALRRAEVSHLKNSLCWWRGCLISQQRYRYIKFFLVNRNTSAQMYIYIYIYTFV